MENLAHLAQVLLQNLLHGNKMKLYIVELIEKKLKEWEVLSGGMAVKPFCWKLSKFVNKKGKKATASIGPIHFEFTW